MRYLREIRFFSKLASMGLLLLMTLPGLAQIANGLEFTTSFPFYVGNARMPAGAYMITQPVGYDETLLQIESKDASHSAFIDVRPTTAEAARVVQR